jgi:C-terminal processing protease CtpA/Prc
MRIWAIAMFVAVATIGVALAAEKKYRTLKKEEMLQMLDAIQEDIKDRYYDPAMHGLNLGERFDKARKEIADAKSEDEALLDIAAAVGAMKNSHTRFNPPARPYGVDYGWLMEAIGDSACFVTAVSPESDALSKGLKPGDQIVSVNAVALTRQDMAEGTNAGNRLRMDVPPSRQRLEPPDRTMGVSKFCKTPCNHIQRIPRQVQRRQFVPRKPPHFSRVAGGGEISRNPAA